MSAVGLPTDDLPAVGRKAELTVFDLVNAVLDVRDSQGATVRLHRMFEPRFAIRGTNAVPTSRHMPKEGTAAACTCGAYG